MRENPVLTWSENATANNATATATHAAETDKNHKIGLVTASLSGTGNTATLTISEGSSTVVEMDVEGQVVVPFESEYKADKNTKVEASLTAGGSGVDGKVSIAGASERN